MAIFCHHIFLISCEVNLYYCVKMAVNSTKSEISKDSYTAAAAGALTAGAGTYGVINLKLKHLADDTVKAFNSSAADCDAFVKKNDDIIQKAVDSKKGFFGKVNKALKGVENDKITETVNKTTSSLIDGYRDKAAKKIGLKAEGAELKKSVNDLGNKFLSKDILKSYKDVNKYKNLLAVSGAVILGAIGGCIIKEIVSRKNEQVSGGKENNKEKAGEKESLTEKEVQDIEEKEEKEIKEKKKESLTATEGQIKASMTTADYQRIKKEEREKRLEEERRKRGL